MGKGIGNWSVKEKWKGIGQWMFFWEVIVISVQPKQRESLEWLKVKIIMSKTRQIFESFKVVNETARLEWSVCFSPVIIHINPCPYKLPLDSHRHWQLTCPCKQIWTSYLLIFFSEVAKFDQEWKLHFVCLHVCVFAGEWCTGRNILLLNKVGLKKKKSFQNCCDLLE